jgi:hypothetical protein
MVEATSSAPVHPSCRYCNEGLIRSELNCHPCLECKSRTLEEAAVITASIQRDRSLRHPPQISTSSDACSIIENYPWFSV